VTLPGGGGAEAETTIRFSKGEEDGGGGPWGNC